SEIIRKVNQNEKNQIISTIINKYKAIEDKFDFILVEGTDFTGEGAIIEWNINVLVAKNLGIPTIIINSGVGKSLDELINSLYMAYDSFRDNGVEVLMVTANKVQPKNVPLVKEEMEQNLP